MSDQDKNMGAEKNETSKVPVAEKPASEKPAAAKPAEKKASQPKPSQPKKPVNKGLLLGGALSLMVIIGLAVGGYWLWLQISHMQAAQVNQSAQVLQLQQAIAASEKRVAELQNQAQDNSNWHQAVDDLEALVTSSAQRWNRQSNRTDARWPLEEALTLTRLAQQRLQLDATATIAIGLLKSADKILASQDQAAVLPLRRQLADDILALQTVDAADVNGFYFALDAIAKQIRELNWVPQPTLKADMPENLSPVEGFWHGLKQIVVIQRLDVPMQAPALQSDFEYWRQHTLLLIEQTQLALLARNQALYETALSQLADQVAVMASQFDTEVWQAKFMELKATVLNPNWPDIATSSDAIELYLAEQEDPIESATEESNP